MPVVFLPSFGPEDAVRRSAVGWIREEKLSNLLFPRRLENNHNTIPKSSNEFHCFFAFVKLSILKKPKHPNTDSRTNSQSGQDIKPSKQTKSEPSVLKRLSTRDPKSSQHLKDPLPDFDVSSLLLPWVMVLQGGPNVPNFW